MSKKTDVIIIKPVNYKLVMLGVVMLLSWQTVKVVQIILVPEGGGKTTQLMVYAIVLCLAFALKESAFKPIRLTGQYCEFKAVMAKEKIYYSQVKEMAFLTKKGQMRTTYDLIVTCETQIAIKDIGVYHKSDIKMLIEKIGSGSSVSSEDIKALVSFLDQVKFL